MPQFTIDAAQLVALFLESIFYGLYLATFGMCIYTLLFARRGFPKMLFFVTLVFFATATLDAVLQIIHVLYAFVWYRGSGGPLGQLSDISYWINPAKAVTYGVQTIFGDGMLIYRCYIVFSRSKRIAAFLGTIWLAGAVVEAFVIYTEFTLHSQSLIDSTELTPFITSVLVATFFVNVTATSLIAFKIWKVQRGVLAYHEYFTQDTHLSRASRLVIESGAMYTTSVVLFFVTYLSNSNADYAVSDCVVQIIGIAFNLLIIRVHQGRAIGPDFTDQTIQDSGIRFSPLDREKGVAAQSRRLTTVLEPGSGNHIGKDNVDIPEVLANGVQSIGITACAEAV